MVLPTSTRPAPAHLQLASRRTPSLELDPGEPLAIGIPRIAIAQLDWMLFQLRHQPDRDEAVHQTRKAAKRVRAVLRLVRGELGYFRYREENVVLRDSARRLSPVRSSAVMVETVDALREAGRDPLPPLVADELRRDLLARHRLLANSVLQHPQLLTDVVVTMLTARSRFRAWPVDPTVRDPRHPDIRAFGDSFDAIAPGLLRTYTRGRQAMESAARERSIRDMHLWRKRVKYLHYQLQVITSAREEVIAPLASELGELGSMLGTEHDLAELGELIAFEPSLLPEPRLRFTYLSALMAHRMELHATTLRQGARLFDETPEAFVTRLGVHWDASRW